MGQKLLSGNVSKFEDGEFIIKGSTLRNYEPFSEYIGSRIFEKFSGLPTIVYDIEENLFYKEVNSYWGYVSVCEKFKYSLTRFLDFLILNSFSLSDKLDTYINLGLSEEHFIRMLIMDALIGNQDRHWNNFDIYTGKDGILKNAPVLDFGASLLYNVPDKDLKITNGVGKDLSKPLKDTHKDQIRQLKKIYGTPKLFDFTWLDLMTLVIECYKNIPEDKFSIKRRIVILHYLKNRYNEYIVPFLK